MSDTIVDIVQRDQSCSWEYIMVKNSKVNRISTRLLFKLNNRVSVTQNIIIYKRSVTKTSPEMI